MALIDAGEGHHPVRCLWLGGEKEQRSGGESLLKAHDVIPAIYVDDFAGDAAG
jgi:hypothetical protein